jgi:hypothetical protein
MKMYRRPLLVARDDNVGRLRSSEAVADAGVSSCALVLSLRARGAWEPSAGCRLMLL